MADIFLISDMLLEERDIQIAQLKQELANAQEEAHYAIGTSELAAKHRDAAEEAFYRLARQHFVKGNRCSCGGLILDAPGIGPFCEKTGKDKPCDLSDLYS